jgi:YD repeat-containing protein
MDRIKVSSAFKGLRNISGLLAAVALLVLAASAVRAQNQLITAPLYLYHSPANSSAPWETTLAAAFADVQAVADQCTYNTCYYVTGPNPDPSGGSYNGVLYINYFTEIACPNGQSCTTEFTNGPIYTNPVCPQNMSGATHAFGSDVFDYWCQETLPVLTSPKYCLSCLGNPICASSGQKLQVETDYEGTGGLKFVRSYRSESGYDFFASVVTQAFINESAPAATTYPSCYSGIWKENSQTGTYCFPLMSAYPYVNSGVAQYQLRTDEGRAIGFAGPNNAVTEAADIDDRVTMLTVSGATEWQVSRDDDTIEIYSATGSLLQKTLRGGRSFTYTYSTTSTPSSIAPYPGLLITQSDAFGHTLNWQYNSSGQMTQMTDPAGGTYQYSYDSSGDLTGVSYPDGSSKIYEYNESANTGGANLPGTLTGITDENSVRYATFQYSNSNGNIFAVKTEHAGGVDSYSVTYSGTYGNAPSQAVVVDPLGTSRTYHFSTKLSYNIDTSQVQPAASGSGNVTQS